MKVSLLLALGCLALAAGLPPPQPAAEIATDCDPTVCVLPDCYCSGVTIPGGLKAKDTPQFVLLTFDDAVTVSNIGYYREALFKRKNPNTCPISATFFISHEYADYSLVHELHANGQEISLHSISHEALTTYWKNATVDLLEDEFVGQRQLVAKFAKIPEEDIKGIRMPFLQMAGNNQFEMLKSNNFLYDLSWTTRKYMDPGLWPYTMDYKSIQECLIGPCPTNSYPDVWVIPMVNWEDENGIVCSMVDACVNIPDTAEMIFEWMKTEFHKHYNGNRAPFGFYIHAAWFNVAEYHFQAYLMFLDYIENLNDVYMVSGSQVIDWMKNPVPVADMPTEPQCQEVYPPACKPKACQLLKQGTEDRWMTSCVSVCPKSYPWLGNPVGAN